MKKIISFILAISTIFINSVAFAKDYPQKFWDVPKEHWAFEPIADLSDWNIINGYDNNAFSPDDTVTRAEWAKMLFSISGRSTQDLNVHLALESCGDLSKYHWASVYMVAMDDVLPYYFTDYDIYYFPERAATREEVVASLVKLLGYNVKEADISILDKFKDADTIAKENKKIIATGVKNKIISGYDDNTIRAQGALTRAEAATLIYNCFNKDTFDWNSCIGTWYEWPAESESPWSGLKIHSIDNNIITYSLEFYRRGFLENQTAQVNNDGTFEFHTTNYDTYIKGKISIKYNQAVLTVYETNAVFELPSSVTFNIKNNMVKVS